MTTPQMLAGIRDWVLGKTGDITALIPAQATSQNQLADKEYVNDKVSTATADFKGTYNSLEDLEQVTANANDYAFVIATDAAGNTVYKRYKWVEGTGWSWEYDLNNSSFTAAQWAAIQSGITAALVTKLSELPTNAELNQRVQNAIDTALTSYYTKTEIDALLQTINTSLSGKASQTDLTAEENRAKAAEQAEAARAQAAEQANAAAIAERYTKQEVNNLLSEKQDTLTFDEMPTKGSTNPVTSDGIAKAIEAGQAEPHENVTVTATANKGDVSSAVVNIYDENDEVLATGVGTVSLRLKYGTLYKVGGARVYDYLTPAIQTFTAGQIMREVTLRYTYIERDVVTLDQSISDPATMLSGDIQGDVIKQIRAASHLYLGTPATQEGDTEGTELICQLDDEDSTKYFDGTTAALDGSEGDQWMKLPVFWWKVAGVGEAAADGAHDQYQFKYAIAGEPDPSWNKWHGDRNLVGAKEMTVIDGKGRSVSGGQSTGSATRAQYNTYAAARNIGCQGVTWEWQWMMCMLFYAWYGNTNSQAVCGIGSNTYARTLGVTDALGMTDTTPSQASSLTSAKFWGLEAWWNCKAEWMGNVTMSNYVLNIIDMNTNQARQVAGFIACGGTGGWTSRMRIDANGDFIPLAKEATETTKYCDWVNSNPGSRVLYRSGNFANAYGGVAYVSAYYAPSDADAYVGSRLAFTGVVTEAESVAAYKAALPAGQ